MRPRVIAPPHGAPVTPVATSQEKGPRVWAFGGGKGGVGKSVVAANVAVSMAKQGRRVVLVDGDLGGANLDTMLGCDRPRRTLSHFFDKSVADLRDLAVETGVEGLTLVAGDGECLGAANPVHAQKLKLIRHLKALPCDLVIIDLGAGTTFNTLDLYLAADVGIVVTTGEPTSLQNCFAFIKTATLRHVEQRTGVQRREHDEGTRRRVDSEGADVRAALHRATSLVVNRTNPAEARRVANLMHDLAGRFLGGQVRLAASIADDPAVPRSIRASRPLCVLEPTARAATDIESLAAELWRGPAVGPTGPRSGVNEEIDHEGQRLHVQTEDLGSPQCAVRTQVFLTDGSVVFTRRTPYVDAFFERLGVGPADRVRFHHVAIVRALRAGRVEPLRRSA
jgi:flagellar biosynthesis protein FlhG